MPLTARAFDRLCAIVDGWIREGRNPVKEAKRLEYEQPEAGWRMDSVLSIHRMRCQHLLQHDSRLHRQRAALASYVRRYEAGESIVSIADSVQFSRWHMARILAETTAKVPRSTVSQWARDLDSVPNERLREEVRILQYEQVNHHGVAPVKEASSIMIQGGVQMKQCAAMDYWSSPRIDAMKQEVGRRFEVYLESVLREAGLPFETEDDARRLGRSRTPDVVLQVPIGVVGPDGGAHVVFWIDSKAMFGDWEGHVEERQVQLDAYVNRFGPGMVVYWFDHIDTVRTTRNVVVASSLPHFFVLPGDPSLRRWPQFPRPANPFAEDLDDPPCDHEPE